MKRLGTEKKGLLTAEQKLLILTPSEYREYKRTKSDVQISRLIGVSRSSLAEWKRKKGLNRKKPQPVQQEMIDVLAFHLDKTKDEIGALPASAIECQYEAFVINEAHN